MSVTWESKRSKWICQKHQYINTPEYSKLDATHEDTNLKKMCCLIVLRTHLKTIDGLFRFGRPLGPREGVPLIYNKRTPLLIQNTWFSGQNYPAGTLQITNIGNAIVQIGTLQYDKYNNCDCTNRDIVV